MNTRIVTIDLGARSYDIYIGTGLIYRTPEYLPQDVDGKDLFIVTDQHVANVAGHVRDSLLEAGANNVHVHVLTPGEQTKSFAQAEALCSWFLSKNISRNSLVFAVGGGVVGDLTGFCASILMRGVPYIHIPTTLLAQVDSSVGGKTGINTNYGKNQIGSFYQPKAVIADLETLQTLPERDFLAGYAEIVKYGLINNSAFFYWLETNGHKVCRLEPEALAYAVETSVRAKAEIVRADETEKGQRALLNLGHTFGHALETAAGYDGRILHGEAVAIGCMMAFELSVSMGLCPRADLERLEAHLSAIGLPTHPSFIDPPLKTTVDQMIEIMARDKKAEGGKLNFILASGIGNAFMSGEVPDDALRDTLKKAIGNNPAERKGRWSSTFSSLS
jgi:3-dehydroquinate synthase